MWATAYAIFETAIGPCGIAWGERGLTGVQLPMGSAEAARARLQRRFPDACETPPPPSVQGAVDAMSALLRGEASDLSGVALDFEAIPPFERSVYDVARSIPAGSTLTYGEVADRLGDRRLAREVGQALGRNPFPIVVPCHRVLAADGRTGGFSAPGGVETKLRMLAIERARPGGEPTLFDDLPLAVRPRR